MLLEFHAVDIAWAEGDTSLESPIVSSSDCKSAIDHRLVATVRDVDRGSYRIIEVGLHQKDCDHAYQISVSEPYYEIMAKVNAAKNPPKITGEDIAEFRRQNPFLIPESRMEYQGEEVELISRPYPEDGDWFIKVRLDLWRDQPRPTANVRCYDIYPLPEDKP